MIKREDFVRKVQEKALESNVFVSQRNLNVIVGAVMKAMVETVGVEEKTLRFNNVGSFKPRKYVGRTIKHPQTGEDIKVKPFTTIAFHCAFRKDDK